MSQAQKLVKRWQNLVGRKITIAEWQLELSAVIYLVIGLAIGFFIILSGSIGQLSAASLLSITQQSDAEFNVGTYANTVIQGTGNGAYVELVSGAGGGGDPWYNTSWLKRRKLTIDNSAQAENLTNFPVLIKLSAGNFTFSDANADGSDIRFTDSNGTTEISYEIESWNSGGQVAEVWVKVPQINLSSNTDYIYIYFDNTAATVSTQDPDAVWTNGYVGVWHLNTAATNGVPGQVIDSTGLNSGEAQNFDANAQSTTQATGFIDGAYRFDGTNDRVSIPDSPSLGYETTNRLTISAWVNGDALDADWETVAGQQTTGSDGASFALYARAQDANTVTFAPNCFLQFIEGSPQVAGNSVLTVGTWNYLSCQFNGTGMRFFHNGVLQNTTDLVDYDLTGSDKVVTIADNLQFNEPFDGYIDEFRLSNVARSIPWEAAEYKNMNNTFLTYGNPESGVAPSGTWESSADQGEVIDLFWNGGWGDGTGGSTAFSATVANVGAGTASITFQMRVGQTLGGLTGAAYSTLGTVNTGTTFTVTKTEMDGLGLATGTNRYVQIRATLASADGNTNPRLDGFTINYLGDDIDPSANASNIAMQKTQGGAAVSAGGWSNSLAPYFTWNPATDADSGIRGYCLYLGTDTTGNPTASKGLLGTSPVDITGTPCLFLVAATNIDFATLSYRGGTWLTTNNNPYYLNIKAIDNVGNIVDNSVQFNFKFDNTLPNNPAFISLPGDFVASKDVTFTWPIVGADAPSDVHSGLAGIQYRISSGGTWYGDNHNGQQDTTDLLGGDGSYTMDATFDYPAIIDGSNVIYIRTWDVAGNVTIIYLTGVLKVNTTSPSAPQNLDVNPDDSLNNSYSFDWDPPVTYVGNVNAIDYCYTVNVLPGVGTCTYTGDGITQLAADAYATQPGENIFYVAARDEASNINYGAFAQIEFTYSGSAPGVPLSLDVSDISVKETENWRLVVSWSPPTNQGAGVNGYRILRSDQNLTCTESIGAFTQIGSTAGTSYTDDDLVQQNYYYCVRACDSANNCSAVSDTKLGFPDGRFTEPPVLNSGPTISRISTRSAAIVWMTGRVSDSKVSFGLATNQYFEEEPSRSEPVVNHEINLNNLRPATTYFARAKWLDEDGNLGISDEFIFTTLPPPSVNSIQVNNIGLDRANVNYTVQGAASVRIRYGTTTSLGGLIEINTSTLLSSYTTEIPQLLDGTKYFYKVNPVDSDGFEYEGTVLDFNTIPRPRISDVQFEDVGGEPTPTMRIVWNSNSPITSIISYAPENDSSDAEDAVNNDYINGEHEIVLTDLQPNTNYSFVIKGRDEYGNEAVSDTQRFSTGLDSRSPRVFNVKIEPALISAGSELGAQQLAQLIVSWDTDEPSTSQVEFSQGIGDDYAEKTQRDASLTFNHLVVISNLSPSQVYHLRVLSEDASENEGTSVDTVTITPKASQSALEVVLGNLGEIFSFLR